MGITGVDYSGLGYGYDWRMKSPDETTYGAGRNIDDGRDGNQEIGRNPDDAKRIGIGSNVDGTERKVNDGNGDHAESVDSKVDKDGKKKSARLVRTVSTSTVPTRQMCHLRVLRMSLRKPQLPPYEHMRDSMYPMHTARHQRTTEK